jgi:predicted nucleic acid-binding protein
VKNLQKKSRPLITSTYVMDEAITLVRVRIDHPTAVGFGDNMNRARWCRVVDVDEPVRHAAWDLFVRYNDQLFSFTDCTSFALMRSMGIGDAFSFDADFAAAGFVRVP